jgi:5'(3')-deoxyribonucleotidase
MTICLDFDNVIMDCPRDPGFTAQGNEVPGAIAGINALRDAGHVVIICTARRSTASLHQVTLWLEWRGITDIRVTNIKPKADIYIDDKAHKFTDWNGTLAFINVIG